MHVRGTWEVQTIPKIAVKIPKRENSFQSLILRKYLEIFPGTGNVCILFWSSSVLTHNPHEKSSTLRLGFFRIQAKGLFDFLTPVTSWHPLSGEHRPLPMVGSGGPAASTFCESLADADAAALKRLRFAQYNFSIMLGGLVNVCIFVPAYTETLLHTFIRCLSPK